MMYISFLVEKRGTHKYNFSTSLSHLRKKMGKINGLREVACKAYLVLNIGELDERTRFNNRVIGMECSASSSSGSSKRARAVNNVAQLFSCLVDGCNADLSQCRDYHRRHKVCEAHSKTPRVTIGGHEQRFCQQCSRFHSLVEFDEGKRSCRKRLDGHNRRRRKPQPESFPLNSGRLLNTQQGTRFMPFGSSPRPYPTTSVGVSSCSGWESNTKPQSEPLHYSTQLNFNTDRKSTLHGSSSFPQTYGHGKQFPFLQCSGSSDSTPVPNDFSALKIGEKLYSDGCTSRVINNNTNSLGALSLLSSPMQQAHPHSSQPQYSSSLSRAQYDQAAPCMDGVPMGSEMYFEPNDSSATASASHQTISFSWE